jgi:hypothetical protein
LDLTGRFYVKPLTKNIECSLTINPAAKYIAFRASGMRLIKAWLAGNGCSLLNSHNAEQGHA